MISQNIKFDVGIRFQPLGDNTQTSEADIRKAHWQLVFTPSYVPETSLTVELAVNPNGDLCFPVFEWPEKRYAHPIGAWTGSLKGIHEFIAMHPMRDTTYSTAYNNCQHWAATFLILMQAAKQLEVVHHVRYRECLAALVQTGTKLYHRSNRFLGNLHILGIGGGLAA
jgi:hypothetical protein